MIFSKKERKKENLNFLSIYCSAFAELPNIYSLNLNISNHYIKMLQQNHGNQITPFLLTDGKFN